MDIALDKNKGIILAIFLLAVFAVSSSYSFYFRIQPSADARAYDNIARNIVNGNGYLELLGVPPEKDNSIIRVGPGYEIFLAVIYYIFGFHYEAVWIMQALLMALSALLVFLITKEIFRSRWNFMIGMAAAALIGFSPDLITMQGMLMTELLGVFLIILSGYLFCRYHNSDKKSWFSALVTGLAIGAATLVRTPAAFLFFPVAVYFFKSKNWKHFLILSAAALAMFTPWIIRNYRVYGVFMPTNAAAGFNLLTGNHPGATGEQGDFEVLDRYPKGLDGFQINKLATDDAVKFMIHNPLEFLKLTFYRTSIYFSFSRPTGFWFHLSGWSEAITLVSSSVYSVLLFVFGFFGIWQIRKMENNDKELAYFFFAMLVMMPLAIIGIIVETRYRMLVYPFFAVFAGFGFSELFQKRISLKEIFYLSAPLVLNTVFDIARNFDRILMRIQGL